MKKLLFLFLVLGAVNFYGQNTSDTSEDAFNKWSIELQGGAHILTQPFTPGYYTDTPSLWNAGLGVRYMFTEKFGLMLDGAYHSFSEGENSLPFESNYLRTSLQGVINLGTIMGLREGANRVNFLLHGGFGYSRLNAVEPVDRVDTDQTINLIAGLTPQVRLTDWLALKGDVSFSGDLRQHYTWDGTGGIEMPLGLRGLMVTGSVGLSIYLGGNDKHADWYKEDRENMQLDSINQRLSKLETDLIDSDQDGVPDYLDREPNTVSGVSVDTKGIAVDTNENGIPDELESSLDRRYVQQGSTTTTTGNTSETIKKLINDGYVNVYFQFNSDVPATYSLEAINFLIKYMKENPNANGQIIGYADEIGEPAYNTQLSERRARRVYDILVAAGIDASRLSTTGNGEDTSVDKSSKDARQLVRRVTFKIQE